MNTFRNPTLAFTLGAALVCGLSACDVEPEERDADEELAEQDEPPQSFEIVTLHSEDEGEEADGVAGESSPPDLETLTYVIGIGPDDVPVIGGDLVAEVDDAAAWGLAFEDQFAYGGNLWGMSYDIIRGPASCGAGKTRMFTHAQAEGQGSCYAVGWYTYDPADCRIRVRINQPGWFAGGACNMFVYAE